MTILRKTSIRAELRQWWIAMNAHHNLFFHLIKLDSLTHAYITNIDAVLHQLESDANRFAEMPYPESAMSIHNHFKHAIDHVIDSLWCYKNDQPFECDVRFNIAKVDMTMLRHELEELHII